MSYNHINCSLSVYGDRQAPQPRLRWECRGQDWPRYFGHYSYSSNGLKFRHFPMIWQITAQTKRDAIFWFLCAIGNGTGRVCVSVSLPVPSMGS